MTAAIIVSVQEREPLPIRAGGRLVSSFACNQGLVVSDNESSRPPVVVTFHDRYAELVFPDPQDASRTLFVYVNEVAVALVTARGPVKMIVPLDARKHHKIVSGTSSSGEATSATSVCT
jgi:hypothetical protein